MGLGVGALVDRTRSPELLGGVTYLAFLAPALLATSAMMVCAQDSLWPVLDGFKWSNAYRAMTATPLTPGPGRHRVALWHATRALITVVGVAVVLAAVRRHPLVGPARRDAGRRADRAGVRAADHGVVVDARRRPSFPTIMRFAIIPMFLFGGVFYPIDQLPGALQPVAMATPLWHGVELCRGRGARHARASGRSAVVPRGRAVATWSPAGCSCRAAFTRRLAS
jgi:lipooligosaccharide transport system permease protein